MPKLERNHDSVRFNPAARFEAKPEHHALQALSIVYQQFNRQLADKPKLSLLESFKINALLLKVHMTRSLARENGVMIFQSDIPSLRFAQTFMPVQLTLNMIKTLQSKGYTLYVAPASDTHLAFLSWGSDTFGPQGWVVYQCTGGLEPLYIDAELRSNEDHQGEDDVSSSHLQRLQISAE
jgi:hypothetical protein